MLRIASDFVPFSGHDKSRSFGVSDSPGDAKKVISKMTIADSATLGGGKLPPGVSAWRTGDNSFEAVSPMASIRAKFTVKPDGFGGSIITEHISARSLIPGVGFAADMIHDVATDPKQAYYVSRNK